MPTSSDYIKLNVLLHSSRGKKSAWIIDIEDYMFLNAILLITVARLLASWAIVNTLVSCVLELMCTFYRLYITHCTGGSGA